MAVGKIWRPQSRVSGVLGFETSFGQGHMGLRTRNQGPRQWTWDEGFQMDKKGQSQEGKRLDMVFLSLRSLVSVGAQRSSPSGN